MSRSKDSPCSTYVELRCTIQQGCPSGRGSIRRGGEERSGSGAELLGHPEEDVVGVRLTDGDAHTLASERTHGDAGLLRERHQVGRPRAERQPDEVALRIGKLPTP